MYDTSERRWEGDTMARGKSNEKKSQKEANRKPNKKQADNIAPNAAGEKAADDAKIKAEPKTSKNVTKSKKISGAAAARARRIAEWEKPEKIELLTAWARDGLSMEEIARKMGISRKTLYSYMDSSLHILHSLRKGKEESDSEVENTLFKKCNGFIQEVLKPMKIRKAEYDPETGKKICDYDEIVYVKDQIYVQPDTVAIKYYLSNRKPDKWKDKIEQVIDTEADTSGVVLLAPVLEKNHEPTEESDMGTTTETD